MIEIKTHFQDWHEVTEPVALKFAATLYEGMVCRNKLTKVHEHIRGTRFTEEQIRDEVNRIAVERMCEGA